MRKLFHPRERAILSLACIASVGIWIWALIPRPPALIVTFLNVGQGDAIVVQTPSGKTILVDCGPGPTSRNNFDAGAKIVTPFLRRQGVNKLAALVLTHPHDDHIGGAPSILHNFKVETVFDTALAHPTGRYREVLETIDDRGINYRQLISGQVVDLQDGVTMEVLNPPGPSAAPNSPQLNNSSIVLRVKYGDVAILLMGDAEKDVELRMLASKRELSAQVLKVGHHGSSEATTFEMLSVVRPSIAIISVGWRNPFGHPSKQTINRLEEAGVKVYRTDKNGGITVTTDGKRIHVSCTRKRF